MDFHLSMDLDVAVTPVYVTYGVTDRLDVERRGAARVRRTSAARATRRSIPFGGTTAAHYLRRHAGESRALGVAPEPRLGGGPRRRRRPRARSTCARTADADVAVLVDVRFPTGGTDDLLGAGKFAGRVLGDRRLALRQLLAAHQRRLPVSRRRAAERRRARRRSASISSCARASRSPPISSRRSRSGDSKLVLPGVVTYESPFRRSLNPTNIPSMRDDIVNGSFGVKFAPARNTIIVLNALFPLNRGGLRPNLAYTAGIERTF